MAGPEQGLRKFCWDIANLQSAATQVVTKGRPPPTNQYKDVTSQLDRAKEKSRPALDPAWDCVLPETRGEPPNVPPQALRELLRTRSTSTLCVLWAAMWDSARYKSFYLRFGAVYLRRNALGPTVRDLLLKRSGTFAPQSGIALSSLLRFPPMRR